MDRVDRILAGIDKSMLGIEIAPWFAPIAPKASGYNIKILDIFDLETLLARVKANKHESHRDLSILEEVDYVGSATSIADLIPRELHGKFDYIISSHNFEHLPNPIGFLNGCAKILRPDGLLSMAVPDRRACFDFFRPLTQIGDWIDGYVEDRQRPTRRQVFDHGIQHARHLIDGVEQSGFVLGTPPDELFSCGGLLKSHDRWYLTPDDGEYHDVHCSVFTPASMELLLFETAALGLSRLRIESVGESNGEFITRIRFPSETDIFSNTEIIERRSTLMRRIIEESIYVSPEPERPPEPASEPIPVPEPIPVLRQSRTKQLARGVRSFGRRLRGRDD